MEEKERKRKSVKTAFMYKCPLVMHNDTGLSMRDSDDNGYSCVYVCLCLVGIYIPGIYIAGIYIVVIKIYNSHIKHTFKNKTTIIYRFINIRYYRFVPTTH